MSKYHVDFKRDRYEKDDYYLSIEVSNWHSFMAHIDKNDNVTYSFHYPNNGNYDYASAAFNIEIIYELEKVVKRFLKNKNIYSVSVPGLDLYDHRNPARFEECLYEYALDCAKELLLKHEDIPEVAILKNGIEFKRAEIDDDWNFIVTDCDD